MHVRSGVQPLEDRFERCRDRESGTGRGALAVEREVQINRVEIKTNWMRNSHEGKRRNNLRMTVHVRTLQRGAGIEVN